MNLVAEKVCLCFRQPRAPVILDRLAAGGGADAVFHGVLLGQGSKYNKNRVSSHSNLEGKFVRTSDECRRLEERSLLLAFVACAPSGGQSRRVPCPRCCAPLYSNSI